MTITRGDWHRMIAGGLVGSAVVGLFFSWETAAVLALLWAAAYVGTS